MSTHPSQIRECAQCGYELSVPNLTTCPECGGDPAEQYPRTRRLHGLLATLLVGAIGFHGINALACAAWPWLQRAKLELHQWRGLSGRPFEVVLKWDDRWNAHMPALLTLTLLLLGVLSHNSVERWRRSREAPWILIPVAICAVGWLQWEAAARWSWGAYYPGTNPLSALVQRAMWLASDLRGP